MSGECQTTNKGTYDPNEKEEGPPPLTDDDISLLKAYGIGPYTNPLKAIEIKIKNLQEEIKELKVEVEAKNQDKMEAEFGDVLFSLINYARFLNIDPETALERTNKKFKYRFELMESYANENGLDLASLSLAEKDALWNKIKSKKPLQ